MKFSNFIATLLPQHDVCNWSISLPIQRRTLGCVCALLMCSVTHNAKILLIFLFIYLHMQTALFVVGNYVTSHFCAASPGFQFSCVFKSLMKSLHKSSLIVLTYARPPYFIARLWYEEFCQLFNLFILINLFGKLLFELEFCD